jgi:hypothetical protein
VLEAAVAACTDVVDAAQELSESCREAQLAKVTIWTRLDLLPKCACCVTPFFGMCLHPLRGQSDPKQQWHAFQALFRRGQALAEASGLEESARAGLKHLEGSLMDRACNDLNLALEMCPGDGAIQAALVDAHADKAGERRRKYRDEKRAAAAADEGAGKKEGGGEEGQGGRGLKRFDDWDRIDYEKECEKIDDEALREVPINAPPPPCRVVYVLPHLLACTDFRCLCLFLRENSVNSRQDLSCVLPLDL